MKLNKTCLFDLLSYLEETATSPKSIYLGSITEDLESKYSKDEIVYHLFQLANAGYITEFTEHNHDINSANWYTTVGILTFSGHEYLETLRNQLQ